MPRNQEIYDNADENVRSKASPASPDMGEEVPLPDWLKPNDDEIAANIIDFDREINAAKVKHPENREREHLPAQLTPSLKVTYETIFKTIDAVEASAYDRSVARSALSGHQLIWAENNYDRIIEIENQDPDVNLNTFSWETKLSGENVPLPFGKGFSACLESPEKPMTMTERAAGLISETTKLYSSLQLEGAGVRATTIHELDSGNNNLETKGYDRMWGMRVSGEDADTMNIPEFSNYIIVTTENNDYQLQVIRDGKPLPADVIKRNLDDLMEYDKNLDDRNLDPRRQSYTSFAPLTVMDRRELHKVTQRLSKSYSNRSSLNLINNALFTVSLSNTVSPKDTSELAQLTQYGSIVHGNSIKYTALNTINGSGIGFTVYANGEAGAKAEHLLVDGNEFTNAVNYVNKRARKISVSSNTLDADTEEDNTNRRLYSRLRWNIPADIVNGHDGVIEQYEKNMLKRGMHVASIENAGYEAFGKFADPALQVAINLAYADIRAEMFRNRNKKDMQPEHQTTFYADEPIHMRDYKDGRVANPVVSGKPLTEYMHLAITDPNSKDLPVKLAAAIKHVRGRVKAAKTKGEAYLTQLMTITAVEKYDKSKPNNNMEVAAKYMRDLEDMFNTYTPTRAMRRLTQAELIGSNGGRKDKLPGIKSFCTVESLIGKGITVGYIVGNHGETTFTIRASGPYSEYAERYAELLNIRLQQIREQFALLDQKDLEISEKVALFDPLRRSNIGRRGQIRIKH